MASVGNRGKGQLSCNLRRKKNPEDTDVNAKKKRWRIKDFVLHDNTTTKPRKRARKENDSSTQEENPPTVDRFRLRRRLGKGNFGTVLLVKDKVTKRKMAMKAIKVGTSNIEDLEEVMMEKKILEKSSRCPFIIHSFFSFRSKTKFYIAMEYAKGGDLETLLWKTKGLDVNSIRFYGAEIVCGLRFIHRKGFIHRDLKPANILIGEDGHIRIADFGLAAEGMYAEGFAGTPGYIAPEVLIGMPYTAAVDWFSFGMVLYNMARHGAHLTMDPQLSDIIQKLLNNDPDRRLGVHGRIKRHPFFHGIDWVDLRNLKVAPPFIPRT